MADELFAASGVRAELVPGIDGIFDVIIDGKVVFSRSETRRLPEPGELARRLAQEGS